MRRIAYLGGFLFIVTCLSSCSTLIKTKMYSSDTYDGKSVNGKLPVYPDGVTYYLPMKFLKVVVTRKDVPTDVIKVTRQAAEDAKAEVANLKTKGKVAKEAADAANAALKVVSPEGRKAAEEKSALLNADYAVLTSLIVNAENKAKKAEEAANSAASQPGAIRFEDDIAVTELPSVPDTSRMFVARLNHWVTHEDKLTIKTTKTGLLDTVTGEGRDKTPQILEDTGKTVISAFKAAAGLPTPTNTLRESMEAYSLEKSDQWRGIMGRKNKQIMDDKWLCSQLSNITVTKFSHEFTFDPSDADSIEEVNKRLCQLATAYRIVIKQVPAPSSKDPKASLPNNGTITADTEDLTDGLVYRSPVPYTVDLTKVIDEQIFPIKSSQVMLPNKGPISVISMETGAFIATNYDISFEDGLLTRLDTKRPSEVHSIVQVPLNILREIIALPTDLIQLKLDYSSKDTSLLESQKKNVEAQEALRKAVDERKKAVDQNTN